ncbi:hypothetical protein B566_EDAN009651 [Ephemera danica]|nr:hypothetical protein B566_EDAN009651 [Ephemera danica]
MRISWVVLFVTLAVAAADVVQTEDAQHPKQQQSQRDSNKPSEKGPMPAAALAIARALTVENLPPDSEGRSATQELQVGDATLVVRRRSKTPITFPSLPQPVYITSAPLAVNGEDETRTLPRSSRAGRKHEVDSDGVPVVHGVRTPDDEVDKYFTWRNARVIRGMLVPYDSRDSRAVHSVKNQYSIRQSRGGEVIRPVLEQGSTAVRAPVLQYAHPELGAQPALSAPDTEPTPTAQAVVYFARDNPQDIHNDHSPYPFEPADLLHQQQQQRHDESPLLTDKRYLQYELKLRPKKTPAYAQYEDFYSKPKRYQQQQPQQQYNNWNKEHRNYKYLQPAEYSDQSYASFYSPQDERPFWERFSEIIRANMQTGMERVSEIARPVVEPIVSASQAFSQNLGLSGSRGAQEKVGVVGPLLGASSVLPAIGLVAGGAALGLGAAAVGRFLENAHSQVVESKRIKRSLLTGGRPLASLQENGDETLDNMVHALEVNEESFLSRLQSYGHHSWSEDTPCAKRIFCDVMTQQSEDSIILMEKKMGTFLSLIHPGVARALSDHMGEVMDAVRRRDCRAFVCAAAEVPSSVRRSSGISGVAVAAPGGGPGPR